MPKRRKQNGAPENETAALTLEPRQRRRAAVRDGRSTMRLAPLAFGRSTVARCIHGPFTNALNSTVALRLPFGLEKCDKSCSWAAWLNQWKCTALQ